MSSLPVLFLKELPPVQSHVSALVPMFGQRAFLELAYDGHDTDPPLGRVEVCVVESALPAIGLGERSNVFSHWHYSMLKVHCRTKRQPTELREDFFGLADTPALG